METSRSHGVNPYRQCEQYRYWKLHTRLWNLSLRSCKYEGDEERSSPFVRSIDGVCCKENCNYLFTTCSVYWQKGRRTAVQQSSKSIVNLFVVSHVLANYYNCFDFVFLLSDWSFTLVNPSSKQRYAFWFMKWFEHTRASSRDVHASSIADMEYDRTIAI